MFTLFTLFLFQFVPSLPHRWQRLHLLHHAPLVAVVLVARFVRRRTSGSDTARTADPQQLSAANATLPAADGDITRPSGVVRDRQSISGAARLQASRSRESVAIDRKRKETCT